MTKKILISLLTVLFILVIWQWNLVNYGIQQGLGQLKVIRSSVPTEKILSDKTYPDSLKVKLELIQEVKAFAFEVLGLVTSDNYSTFFDQGDQVSLWNVSACKPYQFVPKTWWFPIVGTVPYKGFFEKERALNLVSELKSQGWDAQMRPVSGWSTLGWFSDPVLSNMLNRSEGELAELIIHELTHGTLFVEDMVEFNENLASFIGERGAILFLIKKYGADSPQLEEYLNGESDSKKFRSHLLAGTKRLDSLYQSFQPAADTARMEKFKLNLIKEIANTLDTINFSNERYKEIFSDHLPNNAYFMSFLRYHSSEDSLDHLLNKSQNGNLKEFILSQVEYHDK